MSEAMVSTGEQKQSTRARGVGFPVVPLLDAVKTLTEAGEYGAEHSRSAFATYLGHDTTNSGHFREKLAAFKDWKLITSAGDKIVFTQLGRDIALADDPTTKA